MRHSDILSPYQGTLTHPYIATITFDPTEVGRFERMVEDQPDVMLLGIDRSGPDAWTIYAGCASKNGRDLLESNW